VAAGRDLRPEPFAEMRVIAQRVQDALPATGRVRVDVSAGPDASFIALGLQGGIAYALRRAGHDVTVVEAADYLGTRYGPGAGPPDDVVRLDVDDRPPPEGRVIARMTIAEVPDPADRLAGPVKQRAVTVTLLAPRPAG
jgi:hypothetical protein